MQDQEIFERAVEAWGAKPSALIAVLQDIQEQLRYLPRACFPYISKALGVGKAQIYSVATFYENFSLERLRPYRMSKGAVDVALEVDVPVVGDLHTGVVDP